MSPCPAYDGCPACIEHVRRALLVAPRRNVQGPAPTVEQLEKHAARYGPEGVAETAATYGLTVDVPDEPPRRIRRRRTRKPRR